MNPNQEREVQRLIRDHVPDQLKIYYAQWTRQAVGEMIVRRFKSIWLCARWKNISSVGGFTQQRPLKKAYEQNSVAVDKWFNDEYARIAKANGRWEAAYASSRSAAPPEDFLRELRRNKPAAAFFKTLNKANVYAIVYRLETAKKTETREKRMKTILVMLEQGKAFHP